MWHLDEDVTTSAGRAAAGRVGHGPPLVLAHGWPWSSYAWHRVIPALADDYTVYFYDMPGFGQSEKRTDVSTAINAQGQVLAEMLDHWRLDRPQVVAHDFGGAVTLPAHLLHGVDLSGLVLMNIVAMRPWGSAFFDHVGRHVDAFVGLPDHIHRAVVNAYIRGAFAHAIPEEDVDRLVAPWLHQAGRASFYRQFAQADEAHTAEFEPLLDAIRCKTAVLWGVDDPWIPLDRGRDLASRIGVSLIPMSRLGHLPQLEDPDVTLGHIRQALKDVA